MASLPLGSKGREVASNDPGPFEMEKKEFLNMKKLHIL